ncbi:MAG: MBL fold metallo-hydrolase [Chloroflexi bacterium]|nr:MBL fold metallo-hydrolase [Chloroflexota bacterium]
MIDSIQWLGYGSFRIEGPPLIYINPWRVVRAAFHADVILVSHHHYEHCSLADVAKLRGPATRVISNARVAQDIADCTVLRPWQSLSVERAGIKAVPAYAPDGVEHPLSDGGLGFVISLNYHDIYYTGDSKIIPEMDRIRPDIAIVPIDGNGTMNVDEATELVSKMRPRWTIPCNLNPDSTTQIEAKTFERQASRYTTVVMLPYKA